MISDEAILALYDRLIAIGACGKRWGLSEAQLLKLARRAFRESVPAADVVSSRAHRQVRRAAMRRRPPRAAGRRG